MKRVIMFSGGVGSWAAARRVADEFGTDGMVLLFADTLIEHPDTYRFLDEAAADIGVPITRLADGRDPWQVFFDVRFLGNSQVDPCSRILKRDLLNKWRDDNCDPQNTVVYFGIDWTEKHRLVGVQKRASGWTCEAPMCSSPLLSKDAMSAWAASRGIKRQVLYEMGFPHANCGGFCIKAGQAHFVNLLKVMPEQFAYHERREQELRQYLDADVAILRDRTEGTTRPMTLRELRERHERRDVQLDLFEWGGCGCAVE